MKNIFILLLIISCFIFQIGCTNEEQERYERGETIEKSLNSYTSVFYINDVAWHFDEHNGKIKGRTCYELDNYKFVIKYNKETNGYQLNGEIRKDGNVVQTFTTKNGIFVWQTPHSDSRLLSNPNAHIDMVTIMRDDVKKGDLKSIAEHQDN